MGSNRQSSHVIYDCGWNAREAGDSEVARHIQTAFRPVLISALRKILPLPLDVSDILCVRPVFILSQISDAVNRSPKTMAN